MATQNLLYKRNIPINNNIAVQIPTLRQILQQEDEYYSLVSLTTATPCDMMVQLDDKGIDFTTIDDYELFLMSFESLKQSDTSLLFGDLDLKKFTLTVNPQNNMIVLRDPSTGVMIDKGVYLKICQAVRTIHGLKRNNKTPANGEAKKYMIQRARKKQQRNRNRLQGSQLEELIVALVNTEQFPYGYESVLDLAIYQFNESVQQIKKKIDYDNRMRGVYAGTVSAKDMNPADLNWLTHK